MRLEDTNDGGQSGTASVQIGPLDDGVGFYVEDDGWGAPADVRDAVFDSDDSDDAVPGGLSGDAVPGGLGVFGVGGQWGTGGDDSTELPDDIGFTVLRTVANTDGWDVTVTDGPTGGVRVEVRDVLPESN